MWLWICLFRLQDEYVAIQTELKSTIEESKLVQERYKAMLEQSRNDMALKMAEIDELKSQVSQDNFFLLRLNQLNHI